MDILGLLNTFLSKLIRPKSLRILIPALSAAILLLALYLNGPGFRLIVSKSIARYADTQGVVIGFNLAGTALRGIEIENLKLTPVNEPKGLYQSATLAHLNLQYDWLELIKHPGQLNWLEKIEFKDASITLDLTKDELSVTPQQGNQTAAQIALPDLSVIWNLLQSEIELDNVDILVLKNNREIAEVKNFNAFINARDQAGELHLTTLKLGDLPTIENLSVPFRFGPNKLETSINLKEWGIALQPLVLSSDQDAELTGQLLAGGGQIDFSARSKSLSVKLASNSVVELANIQPLKYAFSNSQAVLKKLHLNLVNNVINGHCEFTDLHHNQSSIESIAAKFDQIHFDLNKQILTNGNLHLSSTNLSSADWSIGHLQANAEVISPDLVALSAKALTGEKKLLTIEAKLKQKQLSYHAEGHFNSRMANLTSNENVSGSASAKWQGEGYLLKKQHKGLVEVSFDRLRINGSKEIVGGLNIGYTNRHIQLNNLDLQHPNDTIKLTGSADYHGQSIKLKSIALVRDQTERLQVNGSIELEPELTNSRSNIQITAEQLDPNDLAGFFQKKLSITAGMINGHLTAKGAFDDLTAKATVSFTPQDQSNTKVNITTDFIGNLASPKSWEFDANAVVSGLKLGPTEFEDLAAKVNCNQDSQLRATISISQAGADINGRISADLAEIKTLEELHQIPLQAQLSAAIPDIQAIQKAFPFNAWRDIPLSGDLAASIDQLVFKSGNLVAGNASISAKALAIQNQTFQTFRINSQVDQPNQFISQIDLALDSLATTQGKLSVNLEKKSYQGSLNLKANLASPGKLRALLSNRVAAEILPEMSSINWFGSGDIAKNEFNNHLVVDIKKLRLAANAAPLNFSLAGHFSEQLADFPKLAITGKNLSINSNLHWSNKHVKLGNLTGTYKDRTFLTGSVQAPLDLRNFSTATWFTNQSPLDIQANLTNASIAGLRQFLAPDLPLEGTLNSKFQISGSPAAANVNWDSQIIELALISPEGDSIDLGKAQFDLNTHNFRAAITGHFTHPEFEPFYFSGEQPFHPTAWAAKTRDWRNEKLQLRATMKPSSLEMISTRFPEIKSLSGTLAIDSTINGTFATPHWNGYSKLDIKRLKLRDRNAPNIHDLTGLIRFDDHLVRLDNFSAIVAGGRMKGSGEVDFATPDPQLDFAIKGQDVLLFRNHDINIRSDLDLKAKGPWSKLLISGDLGLDNSYVVKNIDLVPTSLPQLRRSKVPNVATNASPPASLEVGIPKKPFANWTTDLRIHTQSPFLIRGNIGHGSANCDLKITGPLAKPTPFGELIVQEGTWLTLPFSRIDIQTARIRFNEASGFNGQLELKALGKTNDYEVNIFLHNRLLAPEYVLTSNPSLPTEDILTMLATGSLRDDLVGSDVTKLAASKAASLFLKQLQKSSVAQNQNALINELRDRTEIDFGSFNLTNGVDSVGGRIRLWKQLFFVGNASWDDEYRALLKYIFSLS